MMEYTVRCIIQSFLTILSYFPAVCRMPGDSGPCRSFIPRWSYSMTNGQCERFIYGGCGGNGNNFNTRAQCEARCSNAGGGM